MVWLQTLFLHKPSIPLYCSLKKGHPLKAWLLISQSAILYFLSFCIFISTQYFCVQRCLRWQEWILIKSSFIVFHKNVIHKNCSLSSKKPQMFNMCDIWYSSKSKLIKLTLHYLKSTNRWLNPSFSESQKQRGFRRYLLQRGEDHIFLLDCTCDLLESLSYCTLCFTVGGIYCLSTFAILGRLSKKGILASLWHVDVFLPTMYLESLCNALYHFFKKYGTVFM